MPTTTKSRRHTGSWLSSTILTRFVIVMSEVITEANHSNRTKETKLQQIASRILVKPTKLCQTLRSALVTTVVKISSTPRNSLAVVALAAAWAVAWARKSTPKSSSRCLVDRWAAVASVAAWAVVAAEVVVASLEDSTLVEELIEFDHLGQVSLHSTHRPSSSKRGFSILFDILSLHLCRVVRSLSTLSFDWFFLA